MYTVHPKIYAPGSHFIVFGCGLVPASYTSVPQDCFNTLRPRQNGRHFPDDIFKCIFLNENMWISIKIPLKIVPKGPINNIRAMVQKMAWHWSGDKPLSEPMIVTIYASLGLSELTTREAILRNWE